MQSRKQFSKFAPGDSLSSITAPFLNGLIDSHSRVERLLNRSGGGPIRHTQDFCKVLVRNTTGELRNRWDVLCPSDIEFDHATNEAEFEAGGFCFTGVEPTNARNGAFVLLLDAIPDDGIGLALMSGVCPAYIDIQSIYDKYADVYDGDSTQMKSGPGGAAEILWREDDANTGAMWAIIRFPIDGTPRVYGKLDTLIESGSSAAVSRWYWNGTIWVDTTDNDTVYAPPLLTSGQIDADKWVEYSWNRETARLFITGYEC